MAQNSDKIAITRPKADGAAWIGQSTATAPTTAAANLTNFDSLGWLSEDGISMSVNKTAQDIKGYGGSVALTVQTEHSVEFKFKPLELNATVLKTMFGEDNVTGAAGSETVKINDTELECRKWVFDLRGRNKQLIRVVVPNGKLTELGEIPFKTGEPVASEFTIDALPDSNGNKVYIYFGTEQ